MCAARCLLFKSCNLSTDCVATAGAICNTSGVCIYIPVFTSSSLYSFTDAINIAIQLNGSIADSSFLVFSLFNGSLPGGLTLSPSGLLSGIPNRLVSNTGFTFAIKLQSIYGTFSLNVITVNVILLRDGSTATRASTPSILRSVGITVNANYYIYSVGQTAAIQTAVSFGVVDGKDWVLMMTLSQTGINVGSLVGSDFVNFNVSFKGFLLNLNNGGLYYSYYSTARGYNSGNYGVASGGSMGGYQAFAGLSGGMGWYNSGQSPCSWGSSSGSIGAGYDGSCGTYPTSLRMGTGTGGNTYNLMTGSFAFWVWMDQAI